MKKKFILSAVVKEEKEGGYSVVCPELNVASQGESFEEAIANIKEALELYIESAEEIGIMDDVLEQLGVSKKDFKKDVVAPSIVTASIPVEVSV